MARISSRKANQSLTLKGIPPESGERAVGITPNDWTGESSSGPRQLVARCRYLRRIWSMWLPSLIVTPKMNGIDPKA